MKVVKMYRDYPQYEGGPITADVAEVNINFFMGEGWKLDEKSVKEEPKKEAPVEEVKKEIPEAVKPKKNNKKN